LSFTLTILNTKALVHNHAQFAVASDKPIKDTMTPTSMPITIATRTNAPAIVIRSNFDRVEIGGEGRGSGEGRGLVPEDAPGRVPDDGLVRAPDDTPDRVPDDVPGLVPDAGPGRVPDDAPGLVPDAGPGRVPEDGLGFGVCKYSL